MKRTVADVMTANPVTISKDTPFKEMVRLLAVHRISALPVVDAKNIPVGIVSEADLLLKEAYPAGEHSYRLAEPDRLRRDLEKASALKAHELMSSPVYTIGPAAHLGQAARLMHDRGVKRLPVVDDVGYLVGIISGGDVLKAFIRPDSELVTEILDDLMVRTLWIDPNMVTVGVKDGVVTLTGTVPRRSDISLLERLIQGIDGVVGLNQSLHFEQDDVPDGAHPVGSGRSARG